MKTRIVLLLGLTLASIQAPAQSIDTPYSWSTIGGTYQLDFVAGIVAGTYGYANGNGPNAMFAGVEGMAADITGSLYLADSGNHVIRKMTLMGANWVVTTLAGQPGVPGALDGTGNKAQFNNPKGIAVDSAGRIFVADTGNYEIREIMPDGTVTTIAGDPAYACDPGSGTCYRDGPGNQAVFNEPAGVAVDTDGNLYVSDRGNDLIRKMTPPAAGSVVWQVSTLAGNTNALFVGGCKDCNGLGDKAGFDHPEGIAVDGKGNIYVADSYNNKIRMVTRDGLVSDLAGATQPFVFTFNPGALFGNKDGPAAEADFYTPHGVAVDSAGNVYVADSDNCEIRKVTPDGLVTTLGGKPVAQGEFIPDIPEAPFFINVAEAYADGVGGAARFYFPKALAVDADGNLYVADEYNYLIRKGVAPVVQVVALEVIQVIQDWSNSIPLIADKETYVRAHLQLPPGPLQPVVVAGARLSGIGPNGPLPGSPISPINSPDGALTVLPTTVPANDRHYFTNSLNFRLPSEWLSGTITLQLTWSGGLQPINVVPANCSAQVTFVPAAVPQVKFFSVDWKDGGGNNHTVSMDTLTNLQQRILSCFPVSDVAATFGTMDWPTTAQPNVYAVTSKLASQRSLDMFWGNLPFVSAVGNMIYHGAISTANNKFGGFSELPLPSFVSSANVLSQYGPYRQSASHELGHNLGRDHDVSSNLFGIKIYKNRNVNALGACLEEGETTYAYPLFQPFDGYFNGAPTLGPMTQGDNSLIYGLDTLTLRTQPTMEPVLSPTNSVGTMNDPHCYFDLMSYCGNLGPEDRWPSVVTYTNLLTAINATFGPPVSPPSPRPLGGGLGGGIANYLVARGTVDFDAGTAQFSPCLAVTTTNIPPLPPPGTDFLLQALDASGTVLQTVQFGLEPGLTEEDATNQVGDFIVPLNANPSIHMLQLSYNGMVLATLSANPHAPTVTLMTPNGGQNFATGIIGVTWTGSDADGSALTYTVQYSANGGATWQTLAVDWPGQSLDVDSAQLQATTNGLMRVTASDGFNATSAQSAAPFTVQPHAPAVSINSPWDGAIFTSDQQLFLDASASDMQDGKLGGTNVQWHSDRDGALGSGTILNFNAKKLSEGYHTITVTATDSAGLTNSAVTHLLELHHPPPQLGINMAPPSAMLSWPTYYTNYVLQSSTSLASGWATLTNSPPMVFGSLQVATVGLSKGNSFFRLMLRP